MKTFLQRLIPGFSELEVFVVGYATLLVVFSYSEQSLYFLRTIIEDIQQFQGLQQYVNGYVFSTFFVVLFIFLSVYHVFSERKKSFFEKGILFLFMFFVHVAVVIKLALGHLGEPLGMVLVVWNFLYLYILVLYVSHGLSEERKLFSHMIKDEYVEDLEIVITAYTSSILFILMTYLYHKEWFLTFVFLMVTSVPLSKSFSHFSYVIPQTEGIVWSKRKVFVLILLPLFVVYVVGLVF